MRLVLPLGALLVFALSGCIASEPTNTLPGGQIDGAILDQLMNPFGNTTVHLTDLDGNVRTDTSSPLGGFTFRNVEAGFYTLEATPDGTAGTKEVVAVHANDITRIILQSYREWEMGPYKAALQNHGEASLVTPDTTCERCAWSTTLHEVPVEMVLRAEWEDQFDGSLQVILRDGDGRALVDVTDQSAIWATVDGDDIENLDLSIEVRFIDVVPRYGFEVDTFLDVYYGAARGD